MPTYTKEELEAKLAAKGNGGSHYLNPIKADGINVLTAAQEISLVLAANERGGKLAGASAVNALKAGRYDTAINRYLNALDPRKSVSGKVLVGSTVIAVITKIIRRKGSKPLKAGIFKLA